MSKPNELNEGRPSLLVVRDRTDRHPDVPVMSELHGEVTMEALWQEDPARRPYLGQLSGDSGDPAYDDRLSKLPDWLITSMHRNAVVHGFMAQYLFGHVSLESALLCVLRVFESRLRNVRVSGDYSLHREPFDRARLARCYESGEDCPELDRLREELDLAAAEEGVDRDHTHGEFEMWLERRLEDLVNRALCTKQKQ